MMRIDAVVTLFPDLDADELADWIARRWVRPEEAQSDTWIFEEVDVARVRLVYDLRHTLDTPEDTMPLVLSLLDQIYELRCALKSVTEAVAGQPAAVQAAVLAAVKAKREN